MPLEKRPALRLRGAPGQAWPPSVHLCIPDLATEENSAGSGRRPEERHATASFRDPIRAARSKLSEKRFRDGHQQVTTMIEDLRDRRRRQFRRLWIASLTLTAASVVALAIGLFQNMSRADRDAIRRSESRARRNRSHLDRHTLPPPETIPARGNKSGERGSIESALYETPGRYETSGQGDDGAAWFEGTIAEGELNESSDGAGHDHY